MNLKEYDAIMEKHHKKYGSFMMAFHANLKANWLYMNYGTEDYKNLIDGDLYRPNHRRIFPDEVIFDLDTDDAKTREEVKDDIIKRFKQIGLNYNLWKTPANKYHFHMYFPYLLGVTTSERQLLKEAIFYNVLTPELIKAGKIDKQLISNTHLIRAEYGLYEKYPVKKAYKTPITLTDTPNAVPSGLIESTKQNYIKERPMIVVNKVYSSVDMPECVKSLLSEDFVARKDGRDRALFFLIWWFKATSKDKDEWLDKVYKYNKYILNNYATEYILDSKLAYRERSESNFSHKYVHDLLEEFGIKHDCKVDRRTPIVGDAHDKSIRGSGDGIGRQV